MRRRSPASPRMWCGSRTAASLRRAGWSCSPRVRMAHDGRLFPPKRIVCLTEETVETLYLLGEEARIVGVSGYAVRPPQVRRGKARPLGFFFGPAAGKLPP